MNIFITLSFLFFIGSTLGWVLEVFFRRFFSSSNPERKWINPGFCVGPYLPIYGTGLVVLYLLALLGESVNPDGTALGKVLMFVGMAVSMTLIEYVSGLVLLKCLHMRLWDYRKCWGNIQGLICPLFSFFWAVFGAAYYFLVHPLVKDALYWLGNNLAFSFVIGLFFGIFLIDFIYSSNLVARIKKLADENNVEVRLETLKAQIATFHKSHAKKVHFMLPFHSDFSLSDLMKNGKEALEERIQARKNTHK